jgi:hypothetical protein
VRGRPTTTFERSPLISQSGCRHNELEHKKTSEIEELPAFVEIFE